VVEMASSTPHLQLGNAKFGQGLQFRPHLSSSSSWVCFCPENTSIRGASTDIEIGDSLTQRANDQSRGFGLASKLQAGTVRMQAKWLN
jgi:hypothetical protein